MAEVGLAADIPLSIRWIRKIQNPFRFGKPVNELGLLRPESFFIVDGALMEGANGGSLGGLLDGVFYRVVIGVYVGIIS